MFTFFIPEVFAGWKWQHHSGIYNQKGRRALLIFVIRAWTDSFTRVDAVANPERCETRASRLEPFEITFSRHEVGLDVGEKCLKFYSYISMKYGYREFQRSGVHISI